MISIKKITLMISLLCAGNMRALSPAEIAIGIAATPMVAGALHSTYLYNFADGAGRSTYIHNKDAQYTPSQAIGEYSGWFWLGTIPGLNFLVYTCTHPGIERWEKDTIEATALKAGMATDLSVPLAIVLYFAFLRR